MTSQKHDVGWIFDVLRVVKKHYNQVEFGTMMLTKNGLSSMDMEVIGEKNPDFEKEIAKQNVVDGLIKNNNGYMVKIKVLNNN